MFNLSMQCDGISRDQWVSFTVFIVVIKEWNVIWVGFCHFLGGFRVFWVLVWKFDREQPSGMMTGDIKHQHRHHHRDSKWASCPWRSNWRCWNDLTETNYDQRSSDSNFDLPRYHRGAIYQTQYCAVCRTYSYILSKQKILDIMCWTLFLWVWFKMSFCFMLFKVPCQRKKYRNVLTSDLHWKIHHYWDSNDWNLILQKFSATVICEQLF